MDQSEKVRVNKARRVAERRGLTLEKSRTRDPHALDFGKYRLLDSGGVPVFGHEPRPFSATLEQIEQRLEQ